VTPIDAGFQITGEDVEEVGNEDTGQVSSSEENEMFIVMVHLGRKLRTQIKYVFRNANVVI
jgi:hypothetical protein